jgi:hypothetical protein
MPSEPRIPTEPTLDELSAYLDHELDEDASARVAEHVAGCADCQARLDGLRQTAYAIRALPMETPPRTFAIPAKRRESFRWAPAAGWIGGVAAAMLIIVVGVTHLPLHPANTTSSYSPISGGLAQGAAPAARPAAPLGQSGAGTQMYDSQAASKAALSNAATVFDPRSPSRMLTVSTDAASYSSTATINVELRLTGLPPSRTALVSLLLERNGFAVLLPTGSGPIDASGYRGNYQLSNLGLPNPVAGSYTLIAIEWLPDGNAELVARLPITVQG